MELTVVENRRLRNLSVGSRNAPSSRPVVRWRQCLAGVTSPNLNSEELVAGRLYAKLGGGAKDMLDAVSA